MIMRLLYRISVYNYVNLAKSHRITDDSKPTPVLALPKLQKAYKRG